MLSTLLGGGSLLGGASLLGSSSILTVISLVIQLIIAVVGIASSLIGGSLVSPIF